MDDQKPVNVLNPNGELVSLPSHQVQDALGAGYKMATQAHVDEHKAKMGLPGPMTSMETPAPTAPPAAQDPHALIDPALRAQREAETSQWLKEESPRLAASMAGFSAAAPFGAPLGPVGMGVAGTAGAIAAQVGAGAGLNVLQGKPALSTLKKDIVEPAIGGGVGILGGAAARVLSGAGARAFGREAVEAAKFARAAEVSSQEEAARMALKQGDLATAAKQLAAPVESKFSPESMSWLEKPVESSPAKELTPFETSAKPGAPELRGNTLIAKDLSDLKGIGHEVYVNKAGGAAMFYDGRPVGMAPQVSKELGEAPTLVSEQPSALPKSFSIMTAENPNAIQLGARQNKVLNAKLKAELAEKGTPFTEVKGHYGETPENSLLIPHDKITPSEINALGAKYGQESVLHHEEGVNRLRFTSGEKAGRSHRGEGIIEAPDATENFTVIGGKKYQLPIDFSKEHPEMLVHYGRSEAPLSEIDPAFEGTGAVGREAARPERIKRSNYYEIGTQPEPVVVSGSRHVHYVERPENILDISSEDAAPIIKRAQELVDARGGFPDEVASEFEKLAAQSGYAGIKNSQGAIPGHVALFEPQKVVSSEPVSEAHMRKVMGQTPPAAQEAAAPAELPDAPAFYHKAEEIVNEKMGGKATSEQVRAMLKDIKAEEREWLGIDKFLEGKDKVSKQELLDHIAGNKLELKEVTKSSEVKSNSKYFNIPEIKALVQEYGTGPDALLALENDGDIYRRLSKDHPELVKSETWANEILDDIEKSEYDTKRQVPKYSDYQLPGGENYREVLFQMPERKISTSDGKSLAEHYDRMNLMADERYGRGFNELTAEQQRRIQSDAGLELQSEKGGNFRSSHWDEPNVLAHARMNDRVIDGNKTLLVEEIQSDWHQAGRQKGYKGEIVPPKAEDLIAVRDPVLKRAGYQIKTKDGEFVTNVFGDPVSRKTGESYGVPEWTPETAIQEAISRVTHSPESIGPTSRYRKADAVPDAPLKKSWHEFVFKRLLRDAVESGKDAIAWTTGKTQAERFSLRKQVSEIRYNKNTGLTQFKDKSGANLGAGEDRHNAQQLRDLIGKEAAEKVLSLEPNKQGWVTLSGQDLEVGGEGMKGFYDKMMPEYVNKLVKKFGAKVEKRVVDTGEAEVSQSAHIKVGSDRKFYIIDGELPINNGYATRALATKELERMKQPVQEEVHFLKITPELKKLIMKKGLPMFAIGGMVGTPADYSPIMKENYGSGKKRKVQHFADGGMALPSIDDINKGYETALSRPSPFAMPSAQEAPMGAVAAQPSGPINVVNPDGKLVSIDSSSLGEAVRAGYRVATPQDVDHHIKQERFSTPGQQLLTGAEGFAKGLIGPFATGAEEVFSSTGVPGISAEERRAREEASPGIFKGAEAAGFLAPMVASLGGAGAARAGLAGASKLTQAGAIASAEAAFAKGLGLKTGPGLINQVVPEAVKGAFGATLYAAGDEISQAFNRNPNQTAQTAIADLGMAAVLGGVFGGALGAAAAGLKKAPLMDITPKLVSEMDRPALEAGNFEAIVKNSNLLSVAEKEGIIASLGREKADAQEIRKAAERLGAPVLEGMVAESPLIQKAEDALINGAPTYSGIKRNQMYRDAHKFGEDAVDQALGAGSLMTKAELGNELKARITARLRQQSAPIEEMYGLIKTGHDIIPVEEGAIKGLIGDLSSMKELVLSPSAPESKMIKRVIDELENVKTVDDLKQYKSIINRSVSPTAPAGEKRIAAIIGDKLAQVEEESVVSMAKQLGVVDFQAGTKVAELIEKRKAANAMYKSFITDVKMLSEQLGKGRVHGLQDALNFINERLTPEEMVTKLFSKKDSEFLGFMAKKFPEEMQLLRDFQKNVLREEASATGALSPLKLFNKINKLEPEIQKAVFLPEELQKLRDAETYLRAFPKNFNPSGTASKNAFMSFFEHPMGATIANVRDMGIEQFIKLVSHSGDIQNATKLAEATVKGWKAMERGTKALFHAGKDALPANVISLASQRDKLKKLVDAYAQDPAKLMEMNDNNPMPEYASSFAQTGMMAINYLNSIKPRNDKKSPLDPEMPLSSTQKSAYDRQVSLVQQPLLILQHIKNGTIIPQDVVTIKTVYPDLHAAMSEKIMEQVIEVSSKGKSIPYTIRLALSAFLNEPLDSTIKPDSIMAAQPKPEQSQEPATKMPGPKRGTANLNKAPTQFQTPEQAREAHTQKR